MIEVKNLNKTYERNRAGDGRVLKDVSFSLPETGFVCILGPSGCGKTSLLNAIGGLDRFDSGSLSTSDIRVSRYGTAAYEAQRNQNFGYIFQNYYLLENHSVAYNVYLGLHSLDLSHKEKLRRVRMALEAVDMERFIRRKVSDLSGGQQQRIAIARALARRPRVIFADEPTGNLDEANTRNICTLLRQASRESLVIMVTHEERIANFFADRIIRLDQGVVVSDSESWERIEMRLESNRELYTGDYEDAQVQDDWITLRLLRTPDAPPVSLTVVAAKDQIIVKLSDNRSVTLSGESEPPVIIEGSRPALTLDTLDKAAGAQSPLFQEAPPPQCRAGKGLTTSMLVREALQLMHGKGLKRAGLRIFLILLTVLTLLTVSDFITISKVDPADFITHDSHILQLELAVGDKIVEQGSPPQGYYTWYNYHVAQYVEQLASKEIDFDYIPTYTVHPKYATNLFYQMNNITQTMPSFSYVPVSRLPQDALKWGRLPMSSEEIVVDRLVLDAVLKQEGILQNSFEDYSSFLGESLDYGNKGFHPVIVGISDSGERSIYATKSTLFALGSRGSVAITVSELRECYPGEYDTLEMVTRKDQPAKYYHLSDLTDGDCIVNAAKAGEIWKFRLGQDYGYFPNNKTVQAFLVNDKLSAHIIVTDAALETMIRSSYENEIHLWCADKEAMKAVLQEKTQLEQDGYLTVTVRDPYAETYAQYQQAATLRADARTIVTATILVLCMVMLYLLCRTQVNERLELIAVYRLLGIPGRKLHAIFLLEGTISALGTIVPAAALVWLVISLAERIPELESTLELPWQAATVASGGILAYYLLVTLLPLCRLLRLPPARLAAKYDM